MAQAAPTDKSKAETPADKLNWADDASTPVKEKAPGIGQTDGATPHLNGSDGIYEPEYDVVVKLADLQDDPNNPLYSAKTFEQLQLREELLRGLSIMNFRKPSKIQERALPLLLSNPPKNLIGQSQSGTGKTAAFVLNMLTRVDLTQEHAQCIVLAPTRELAKQIAGVASLMGAFLVEEKGLKIVEAVPDAIKGTEPIRGQIVVGTPGTTMDLIKRKRINPIHIKVLTLDEADNMLDVSGLGDQCKRVKNMLPKNIQVVLFSATFPEVVLKFASVFAPDANQITLQPEKLTVDGIKQMFIDCQNDEDKYNSLVKFYQLMTIASSIIFVKRRDTAAEIERRMTENGYRVASLTGALDGAERDRVFEKFRSGAAKVLITTNVLARGIDVQTVTLVINYDIPEKEDGGPDYETYLHRIGRTGRFGRTGAALSFVHDKKSWQQLQKIQQYFKVELESLDTSDWDKAEKQLKKIMKNPRNAIRPLAGADALGEGKPGTEGI